ncbi:hypothetical protein BaRGS_00007196 [Batillaria attramentaria]|uniref:Uncharacterized protein n=1 Tax=Batillaria attramentaria TaxID=370345 RepID=A0ABD0LR91_9CAEN
MRPRYGTAGDMTNSTAVLDSRAVMQPAARADIVMGKISVEFEPDCMCPGPVISAEAAADLEHCAAHTEPCGRPVSRKPGVDGHSGSTQEAPEETNREATECEQNSRGLAHQAEKMWHRLFGRDANRKPTKKCTYNFQYS